MPRRERSAAGTVEQAETPVTSTPSGASRPRSIRPSSSAVDLPSVLIRQEWTSLSPVNVAKTVFVFPMSMQSSTARSLCPPAGGSPTQVECDIHDRRGVGEPAHREVVHAGLGHLPDGREGEPAGG